MRSLVFVNGRIVTPSGILDHGCVEVCGNLVAGVSNSIAADRSNGDFIDLGGDYLLPGFVDVQVNGGGGLLFNDDPSAATAIGIAKAHRPFGTTSLLPTLISGDLEKIEHAIRAIDGVVRRKMPGIAGVHIEGPFLNVEKRGVHDKRKLRQLSNKAMRILTSAEHAQVVLTLAPERARLDQIAELVESGVKVCIGHTNATFEETRGALEAGVSGFTHLFNAMPAMQSRNPGVIAAALESSACCGVIVDGKHVHPAMLRLALRAKSDRKLMLVTDAMPVVGADIDHFYLNKQRINVADGVCLSESGTLAGAALSMIEAVKNAMTMLDLSIEEASVMASRVPCSFLGIADRTGSIAPGRRADLLRISPKFAIRQVWIDGVEQRDCRESSPA
ncbi:MAG: N-acetylglucosamine-6-phosphate deacetylase [Gammaproteobacteria bacterium]|nr:N-acetylglucosamine-6-phosphate deacetylase [Gammaproteobacteria bacterium]MXW44401.1 N-acetylglucosamine-6-phosphate deacetylase [Gammaproteobacteria bacterium]MYD02610.1 N-acetylglucosamine-6-phosphate deacetylase [Gammaproteobacteria bacterium]MYI26208.1 N-acetylglucosamine-6-phosphate deacetylase [Gammaproteobacteria bacterium]